MRRLLTKPILVASNRRNTTSSRSPLVSLTLDTPFKRAFSDNNALKHFLNSIFKNSLNIVSINNVEVKSHLKRSILYDLHCSLSDGSIVIIELQKEPMKVEDMIDRCVRYMARGYSEQWLKSFGTEAGSSEYSLVPVLSVAILDWTFDTQATRAEAPIKQSLVQRYVATLSDGEATPSVHSRIQRLADYTFVQLPLAPKIADESCSEIEKWAILLRDSALYSMDKLPTVLQVEPFLSVAKSAQWDILSDTDRALVQKEEDKARADKLVVDDLNTTIKEREKINKEQEKEIMEKHAEMKRIIETLRLAGL